MNAKPQTSLRRVNEGWLAEPERRVLDRLAPRLPRWMTPGRLTVLGLLGAVLTLVSYLLAIRHPAALWLVNLGLLINWFGDSLDGAVARLRGMERPRYGFFLDQSTDVVAQALFSLGLGLSGYIRPEIVGAGFAAFLMMTVQSLLRAEVTNEFHLAAGKMGLTELRCLFVIMNILFYLVPPQPLQWAATTLTYADVLGTAWILGTLYLYGTTMLAELRRLNAEDDRS
jgi:phosphatidylglycerophosphate synthase